MSPFEVTPNLYASLGKRFANYIIDYIAHVMLLVVVLAIVEVFIPGTLESYGRTNFLLRMIPATVVILVYYSVLEGIFGTSLGKLVTGTRVVTLDGNKPRFETILTRSLCRLIPFEAFSGLSDSLFWHDTISQTYVVEGKALDREKMLHESLMGDPSAEDGGSQPITF